MNEGLLVVSEKYDKLQFVNDSAKSTLKMQPVKSSKKDK